MASKHPVDGDSEEMAMVTFFKRFFKSMLGLRTEKALANAKNTKESATITGFSTKTVALVDRVAKVNKKAQSLIYFYFFLYFLIEILQKKGVCT